MTGLRRSRPFGVLPLVLVGVVGLAGCAGSGERDLEGDDLPPGQVEAEVERDFEPDAMAPLPEPRTEVAGAAFGDAGIVVVGGLRADGTVSSRADRWDPGTGSGGTWTALPDLPLPLHHTGVVSFRDRVWVIGGYTVGADGGWVPSAAVFSLGVDDTGWQAEPSLRTARGALAAAATASRIVVAGGVGPGNALLDTVEMLPAGASDWTPGPALTTAREHFALVAAGDDVFKEDVFAIGGRTGGLDTNLDSVEVLRSGTATWAPEQPLRRPRGGIGGAALGRRPCVAGGEEPGGTIGEVECLGPDGMWEIVGALGQSRHGLAVVSQGDVLHVVGGGPEPGLTVSDAHEVLGTVRLVTAVPLGD